MVSGFHPVAPKFAIGVCGKRAHCNAPLHIPCQDYCAFTDATGRGTGFLGGNFEVGAMGLVSESGSVFSPRRGNS